MRIIKKDVKYWRECGHRTELGQHFPRAHEWMHEIVYWLGYPWLVGRVAWGWLVQRGLHPYELFSAKPKFRPIFFHDSHASESVRPSHFPPTDPIPVVVKDVLKCKKNEEIKAEKPAKRAKLEPKKERKRGGTRRGTTKRKAHNEIDDEKPAKRARTHQKKAQEGPSKSAKNPPTSRPTTRRTGAGKR
ncbi:hypothetical protein K438DRAFT_1776633 [Mycena galopus ATCC 62051]|nr:hypothetical protein K438DRAFT_1776633 [Mycena galopus ATCC 62051]